MAEQTSHSPNLSGDERESPPRKRPRTKAPPRAAAAAVHSTDTVDSAHQPIPSQPPSDMPEPPQAQPTQAQPPHVLSSETHRFSIQPLNRFQGASARIKRPCEVAHFSYDDNHEYRDDDSSVNYYVPPPIGADLKEGFDTFRHYEDKEDPHLDSLLRAVMHKESSNDGSNAEIKADFVTWRGMMTKIMTAPYDNFAEFSMFATLHKGTIYLEEDFPSRAASRAAESSRPPPRNPHPDQQPQAMMTYWGYKFETLSLIPTPPSSTSPAQIAAHQASTTSNHAQHCSIVSTSFGPHTLLLGGEVDGLLGPKPPPTDTSTPVPWVELKTAEQLPPPHRQQHRDILRFERKLLKFWAQSFLLGVPTIIVGFRTKSGVLTGLQSFKTHELPGMVRRGTGCWDGNVCINFAAEFLGWLKGCVREEGRVYSVVLRKKSGVVEVREVGEGTGGIVSEEFVQWREGRGKDVGSNSNGEKPEEEKEEVKQASEQPSV